MFKPDRFVAAAHAAAWATFMVAALGPTSVAAQTAAPGPAPAAAPSPAPAAASKAEAAAPATAAMERARRQAAGPLRVILEASKTRRRAGEAEPSVAAEASAVRPVVARAPAPSPAPGPAPQVVAASAAPASPPALGVPPAPAATAAVAPVNSTNTANTANTAIAEPDPGVVTQITLSSDALQSQSATAAVPGLDIKGSTRLTGAAVPQAPAWALPELVAAPARPRLVTLVEPELPQRVLDELGRNAAVLVDLTIRPDGSVTHVALVSAGARQLQRFLVPTLSLWKFEPLPAERVHRVKLVFNDES